MKKTVPENEKPIVTNVSTLLKEKKGRNKRDEILWFLRIV